MQPRPGAATFLWGRASFTQGEMTIMGPAARFFAIAAAVALLAVGAPARAQYLWLDTNGDGVNTAADHLAANGTPTTVDAWINTSRNKDGSTATCTSGEPDIMLQNWNAFAVHLNVTSGTAAFTGYMNRVPSFSIGCVSAGRGFSTNDSTQMSVCQASGTVLNNGGTNQKMFTITVTVTSGTPSLVFVPTNSLDQNPTSFGSPCSGMDFDHTIKLGSDFHDADGIVTVIEPGTPPFLTAPATASATEGQPVSITSTASDPDAGQILTISATGQPTLLTLATAPGVSPVSATLSGTLDFMDQGSYTITWLVSDGINQVTAQTLLMVANVDRSPVIEAPLSVSGRVGVPLSVYVGAYDPDPGPVEVTAGPLPTGATFSRDFEHSSGTLSWTPTVGQEGGWDITFTASNGLSASATTHINIGADRGVRLGAIADITIPELEVATCGITASDADGDLITLTASLPPFAELESPTSGAGSISTSIVFAPGAGMTGSYMGSVTATSYSLSDTGTFTITVTPPLPDAPPVVTAPASVLGTEAQLLSFTATASDPDGDAITFFNASPLPAGATFTPNATQTSGTFQWTPSFVQAGVYSVTLSAQAACDATPVSSPCPAGASVTNITIANVDRRPTLSLIADVTVPELAGEVRSVLASDPDGDGVALTGSLPSFAVLQPPTTGSGIVSTIITLNPGQGTTGSYTGSVTATSGALSDTRAFAITVTPPLPPDAPPVVTAPASVSGEEAQALSFTATASDPDGDVITFFTAAPLPAGATFTANGSHTSGTFHWTPTFAQSGVYTVTLSAKSSCRATGVSEDVCMEATAVTNLTIADADQPPVVVAPTTKSIGEGSLLSFTVTAMDPNGEAILSLAVEPLPAGATFTANAAHTSGTFAWTPAYNQSGSYVVAFTAKTVCGVVAGGGVACPATTATTTITVQNVDSPPLVAAPPTETVDENAPLTFGVSVTEPDGDPVDSLKAAPLPSGATFTANATKTAGTFDWTPSFFQAGSYTVTITAKSACRADPISGPACGVGTAQTHITVTNVDRPPIVATLRAVTGDEGALVSFQATASDPDAEAIESFEAAPLPAGATFTMNAAKTSGTFSWTPGFDAAGAYSITLSAQSACRSGPVSEPVCGTGSAVTAITIRNVDRPPTIAAPAAQTIDEGATLTFPVLASDPDGDAIVSLGAGLLPPGATFAVSAGNTSGTFTWTPDYSRAIGAPYTAIFLASNALTAFARTDVTVNNVDGPPQVACPASIAAQPNQFVTFTVSVTDPEGDAIASLRADMAALPTGTATFSTNATHTSGTFAWTPQLQDARDPAYPVTFTATNARTGSAQTLITVRSQNHAPIAEAGGPYAGYVGVPVLFDATGSSDPDGDALQYAWSFGDGMTAAGPTPWHTYAAPLDGKARVTVTETFTTSPLSAADSATVHVGTSLVARAFATGGYKTLRLRSGKPFWCAQVEPLNGVYHAADIDPATVVMRSNGTGVVSGIAAIGGKTSEIQDADRNGLMDLTVCFDKEALIQLLSKVSGHKQVPVQIAGRLVSGAPFEATLTLDVVAGTKTLAASIAPNPFNPATTMSFRMDREGAVDLRIFDMAGRLVRDVTRGRVFTAGYQEIRIDGKNENGHRLASGVYFYRLSTSEGAMSGRLVILE
jgi:hypothetical protein